MQFAPPARERILLDLRPLRIPVRPLDVTELTPGRRREEGDADEGAVELAVTYGSHWFLVTTVEGAWAEQVCAVMSVLQDDVMDDLGHGWPELVVDDRFAGLLQPEPRGELALWVSPSGDTCPIGSLADAFGPLIRW